LIEGTPPFEVNTLAKGGTAHREPENGQEAFFFGQKDPGAGGRKK
jgi:hypothetical protein